MSNNLDRVSHTDAAAKPGNTNLTMLNTDEDRALLRSITTVKKGDADNAVTKLGLADSDALLLKFDPRMDGEAKPKNQKEGTLRYHDIERVPIERVPIERVPIELAPLDQSSFKNLEFHRVNDPVVDKHRKFEGARHFEVGTPLEEFKANRPDGSMQVTNDKGVYTYWPNGSVNVRRFDGTGYSFNPDGNGGCEYKQWGPKDSDNFSSKYDSATNSLTEIDSKGSVTTRWSDGTEQCQRLDGSGYSKKYIRDYLTETKHWGPKIEDNYMSLHNVITGIGQIRGRNKAS